MEDPRWLRLLTIGLVLAALVVGYFLFIGKFASNSAKNPPKQVSLALPSSSPSSSAYPTPIPSASSQSSSAYNRIAARSQGQGVQAAAAQTTKGGEAIVLPRTGFPLDLVAILSVSVMISGWGLRRFPH